MCQKEQSEINIELPYEIMFSHIHYRWNEWKDALLASECVSFILKWNSEFMSEMKKNVGHTENKD
jgi:hypothetical protein